MTITYFVEPSPTVNGEIRVPGDKSISHRAIILGSVAEGVTRIRGFLEGEDCLATKHAFMQLGVRIESVGPAELRIHGVGLHGLTAYDTALDLGNSGTSMRLLTGLLAGQPFASRLVGDQSLMNRPMRRVQSPLQQMGAHIEVSAQGMPPIDILPVKKLQGIQYAMPVASAQVKSAVLLAALYAEGETIVTETTPSRDHTERMLQSFGAHIESNFPRVSINPTPALTACDINVPGDLSSAAFFIVAACLGQGSQLTLRNVGINPTRTGVIDILQAMGANISLREHAPSGSEPVADIDVTASTLRGIEVPVELIPSAIDEFPILCVAAACAQGTTVFRDAAELRVKESDRIDSVAKGLRALGVDVEEFPDGLAITGGELNGGCIESFGDHRIAMAFTMASLRARQGIEIRDCANVATSFPGFDALARGVGIQLTAATSGGT